MKTAKTLDEENGKGLRGDETQEHAKAKLKKLLANRETKARLKKAAEERAARLKQEREEKEKEKHNGRKPGGPPPKALDGKPEDKAQSNYADPESRIINTKNGFSRHTAARPGWLPMVRYRDEVCGEPTERQG